MTVDEIEDLLKVHIFDAYRDGSGWGVCGPFPCATPMCGWEGQHTAHARHVAELIADTKEL